MSMTVLAGGVLSLLQDRGRRGHHRLGLGSGGPLDAEAFGFCQRLLQNAPDCTAIEISTGGLELESAVDTCICLTGAAMPLSIDGAALPRWTVHRVTAGARIRIGYASAGCRAYLGVADGFTVPPMFGSTATVVREGVGGLGGTALQQGDRLPCAATVQRRRLCLPPAAQPRYHDQVTLRVVPGYQQRAFSRAAQRRFFGSAFTVSGASDRMGYRLLGPRIDCELPGLLSEGICAGAVQVPPDGQPIVLLADRQTIGGYPKLGAALSLDTARLAQLREGGSVHFAPITAGTARRALRLAATRIATTPLPEYRA